MVKTSQMIPDSIRRLRTGVGTDVHRLVADRPCVLGGITIDSPLGPDGHSDADVLLHALCDAILGAAGDDDLGTLFKNTDPAHRGRSSSEFCVVVRERVEAAGFTIVSLDATVETEVPKLMPHRAAMRKNVAALFGVAPEAVNLKGKSGEGVDAVGERRAMRAVAVALLWSGAD